MEIGRRRLGLGALAAATAGALRPAGAQPARTVRLGALSDLSSAYADISGPALVEAIRMAIADFGPVLGEPAQLVVADCQLKADVASTIARQWWDAGGVDAIIDLPSTPVALAIMGISEDKKKVVLATSPGSSDVTGRSCSPYTAHWVYDSYALAKTLSSALVRQGADSWFFIAADYAFGASLVADSAAVIQAAGGKVLGVAKAPLNASDFSSYLLQAQASGAKVIALANGGNDTVNCIKQAAEFGLAKRGQQLAALVLMDTDVHALGLPTVGGTLLATGFYWDRTPESRAWSRRFFQKVGRMPTMLQAGAYSQTTHYLKAVKTAGTTDAEAVMVAMRDLPVRDFFAPDGQLRRDGRMVHDMFLARVKTAPESRESWDQYEILATVPGTEAFRPLDQGGCRLIR